jgi:hypothetical protein
VLSSAYRTVASVAITHSCANDIARTPCCAPVRARAFPPEGPGLEAAPVACDRADSSRCGHGLPVRPATPGPIPPPARSPTRISWGGVRVENRSRSSGRIEPENASAATVVRFVGTSNTRVALASQVDGRVDGSDSVVAASVEEHLRLVIDEQHRAVVRGEEQGSGGGCDFVEVVVCAVSPRRSGDWCVSLWLSLMDASTFGGAAARCPWLPHSVSPRRRGSA